MIKNIFIPEKIGSYYLLTTTIVGIDITKSFIHASKIIAKGNTRQLIEVYEEPINTDVETSYEEQLSNVLKILKDKLGNYNILNVSISSSHIVFKEVIIPFLGESKVKAVLPFEIEGLLPFNLNQAAIDAIITKEDKALEQTDLLVTAITTSTLDIYLNALSKADIEPDKITIDIIELYAIYKSLYNIPDKSIALIDLDLQTIKTAIIVNNQLKYIRVLNKGLKDIIQKIKRDSTVNTYNSTAQALQDVMRFGISDDNRYIFQDLISELQFTIMTTLKNLDIKQTLSAVYITGFGADIQGISDLICSMVKTECHTLETNILVKNQIISSKIKPIPQRFLVSIATALPIADTQNFNLSNIAQEKTSFIKAKQLLAMLILSLLVLGSFLTYSFIKSRQLRSISNKYSNQAIKELEKRLNINFKRKSLTDANKEAEKVLSSLKNTVSILLTKKGYTLLYLEELSKIIDKTRTELKLNRVVITPAKVELYGNVKDIEAAVILENQLKQSSLFNLTSSLETPDFTKKPLILEVVDQANNQSI